jgi:apolipoprotein N-acyltransferase
MSACDPARLQVIAAASTSIATMRGWRRHGLALAAGIVSVLAMAPFFLAPFLFATLPIFVWLLDGAMSGDAVASSETETPPSRLRRALRRPAMRAAVIGWWFGFGYFLAGLFWIGEAFLVEAEKFAVLLPFAVTLLPAGLALFWAAAAALASFAWLSGLGRLLALALTLSAAEWLRGHILTGFPWNVLGYALTWPGEMMQSASVLGIWGLTLLVVPIFAGPLVLVADVGRGQVAPQWRLIGIAMAVVPAVSMYGFGLWRIQERDPTPARATIVRIVQPSIPQREKWRPENQERIFNEHIALSRRNASGQEDGAVGVDLIIWPEAAMPFLPLQTPSALAAIGRLLPEGTHLLSGAIRLAEAEPGAPVGSPQARRRIYNSLMVFGAGGRPVAVYDKTHLVPFGEYLPLQATLEAVGLEQLSRLRGGFATGPSPRPSLEIPGLPPLAPLICYEAIFPRTVVQSGRPAAMVNLTNDGWFGNTTGPRQHLHQARVRAVEEGIPLLRAANNGVSAVIDAKGRLVTRLDLDVVGVIDATLPAALLAPPIYARSGDALFAIALLLAAVVLALARRRATRS